MKPSMKNLLAQRTKQQQQQQQQQSQSCEFNASGSFTALPSLAMSSAKHDDDSERLKRNITAVMREFRELSHRIKKTQQFATTKHTFEDWASDIVSLANKCEDCVFDYFALGNESSTAAMAQTPKGEPQSPQGKRKFNIAELVKEMKKQDTPPATPPANTTHSHPPRGPGTGRVPHVPASPRANAAAAMASLKANPTYAHAEMIASSLHLMMDAALRSVNAMSATLYAPVNSDAGDLRAVCDVGHGPDTVLEQLRQKDPASAACLAATTGVCVTICRGHEPVAERKFNVEALSSSITMASMAASASPKHSIASPLPTPKITRTSVWSSVSMPVRLHSAQQAVGVLHLVNKDMGKSNFETEDEHAIYGFALMIATMLQRHPDTEILARHYNPTRPLPPVAKPPKMSVRVAGRSVAEPHTGLRSQLVWRTWGHAGQTREVKVIIDDQAVRLDERLPLTKVYDYIEKMQTAWQNAVLLNVEFQQAFDQRTEYMTALLQKLKLATLRNESLRGMVAARRASLPTSGSAASVDPPLALRPAFVPEPPSRVVVPEGSDGAASPSDVPELDSTTRTLGGMGASVSPGANSLDSDVLIAAVEQDERVLQERLAEVRRNADACRSVTPVSSHTATPKSSASGRGSPLPAEEDAASTSTEVFNMAPPPPLDAEQLAQAAASTLR